MQLPIGINITQLLTALLIIHSCNFKNFSSSSSEITHTHGCKQRSKQMQGYTHARKTHTHTHTHTGTLTFNFIRTRKFMHYKNRYI